MKIFFAILAATILLGWAYFYFNAQGKDAGVQTSTLESVEQSNKLNLLKIQQAVSQEEKDAAILAYQADIDTLNKMTRVPRAKTIAAEMEVQLEEARTRPLSPTTP